MQHVIDVQSIATAKERKVAHSSLHRRERQESSLLEILVFEVEDSSEIETSFKYWQDRSRIREERKSPHSLGTQNDSQEADILEF
jgi:hypothetical protein